MPKPPAAYIDGRLFAGAGVTDCAQALEWRGFRFEGRGHRPAPGTEGYFSYFCAELQCEVKRYAPSVWIGHMGPGPTTNGSSFEDCCSAAVQALCKQQAYSNRILERLAQAALAGLKP